MTIKAKTKRVIAKILSLTPSKIIKYIKPLKMEKYFYVANTAKPIEEHKITHESKELVTVHHTFDNKSEFPNINKRLSPMSQVFLLINKNRVIHETWVFFDSFVPAKFDYNEDVPLIGACVTDKNYRGYNIYPYMLNFALNNLIHAQGFKEVYITSATTNIASNKGIEKTTFKKDSIIKATRVLGFFIKKFKLK